MKIFLFGILGFIFGFVLIYILAIFELLGFLGQSSGYEKVLTFMFYAGAFFAVIFSGIKWIIIKKNSSDN